MLRGTTAGGVVAVTPQRSGVLRAAAEPDLDHTARRRSCPGRTVDRGRCRSAGGGGPPRGDAVRRLERQPSSRCIGWSARHFRIGLRPRRFGRRHLRFPPRPVQWLLRVTSPIGRACEQRRRDRVHARRQGVLAGHVDRRGGERGPRSHSTISTGSPPPTSSPSFRPPPDTGTGWWAPTARSTRGGTPTGRVPCLAWVCMRTTWSGPFPPRGCSPDHRLHRPHRPRSVGTAVSRSPGPGRRGLPHPSVPRASHVAGGPRRGHPAGPVRSRSRVPPRRGPAATGFASPAWRRPGPSTTGSG